jgi:hypothetical protein
MSAEAEAFVENNSPYTGDTYAIHFRMGMIANETYEYRLFMGDAKLAHLCRCSVKTVQRARKKMIADGFLECLEAAVGQRVAEYRFIFKHAQVGGHSVSEGGHPVPSGKTSGETTLSTQLKEESKEVSSSSDDEGASTYSPAFEKLWANYPRKVDKKKAYRAAKARIKAGAKPSELAQAVDAYAAFVAIEETETKYIKHAATFFGPDEPWREWLDGAPTPTAPAQLEEEPSAPRVPDFDEAEYERVHTESVAPPKSTLADIKAKLRQNLPV